MSKNKSVAKGGAKQQQCNTATSTDERWERVRENQVEYDNARSGMAVALRTCIDLALKIATLLRAIQKDTEHGAWEKEVKANCKLGIRQVQRYLKLLTGQEKLSAFDPKWREKYTLVEALELLAIIESEESARAVADARQAQSKSKTERTAVAEKPKTKSAARKHGSKSRSPSAGEVKSAFKTAHKQIDTFHKVVESINKPATLELIEEEASRIAKECNELIAQCKQQRQSLEGLPKKPKLSLKAADPGWGGTGAVSKMGPTAKHAPSTAKNRGSTTREIEPSKA